MNFRGLGPDGFEGIQPVVMRTLGDFRGFKSFHEDFRVLSGIIWVVLESFGSRPEEGFSLF